MTFKTYDPIYPAMCELELDECLKAKKRVLHFLNKRSASPATAQKASALPQTERIAREIQLT